MGLDNAPPFSSGVFALLLATAGMFGVL